MAKFKTSYGETISPKTSGGMNLYRINDVEEKTSQKGNMYLMFSLDKVNQKDDWGRKIIWFEKLLDGRTFWEAICTVFGKEEDTEEVDKEFFIGKYVNVFFAIDKANPKKTITKTDKVTGEKKDSETDNWRIESLSIPTDAELSSVATHDVSDNGEDKSNLPF